MEKGAAALDYAEGRPWNIADALGRDHRLDGVRHLSHWGFRQTWGGVWIVRDDLAEIGVPLLSPAGDGLDERTASLARSEPNPKDSSRCLNRKDTH